MATKKVYDLAVKVGSYVDSSGQQKNKYMNVGVVLQKDDGGMFLMLSRAFNPAGVDPRNSGDEMILISMFAPSDKENGNQEKAKNSAPSQQIDDEIPF